MLASDLPYGEVATSAALAAIRSGLDIVIVNTASDHIGEIALVANPKGNVHKVKDLAGKKAGFTGPKSTSELLLRLALKEAGMTGKVEPVATGGFGGGLTLLDTGGIDAAPLIDPILTLKPDKISRHLPFRRPYPAHDVAGRRDDAQICARSIRIWSARLIDIHRRGVDYIYAHHDEAIAIYAKIWQQEAKDVATYFPKYFGYKGEWSLGGFDKEALGKMSDGLQLIGELQRTDRLEGRDRHSVPAQGLAKAALIKRQWHNDKGRRRKNSLLSSCVFSALELLCRLGIITRVTMIPPTEMVTSLWDIVESGRFNSDISFTFFNVVAAAVVRHWDRVPARRRIACPCRACAGLSSRYSPPIMRSRRSCSTRS